MQHNLEVDAMVFFQKIGVQNPSQWALREYVRCAEIYQRDARAQGEERDRKLYTALSHAYKNLVAANAKGWIQVDTELISEMNDALKVQP